MGWSVIAFGLRGIVEHSLDTRPADLARFVVGGALLHDLVFAPLVIGAGVMVARAVPKRARVVVQAALVVSGIVTLFAYPLVRGYGVAANNPSSLPHNYARNLLIVLAIVWVTAAVALAVTWRLNRSAPE